MLKKLENFTAQFKLIINNKFGPVVAKSGGQFIRLYMKDPEEHCKPTKFLKEKSIEYFVIIPKWERPIKIIIRDLHWETRLHQIKEFLENVYKFKGDKVVQLTKLLTKRPLPLFQITLPNKVENKGIWNIDNVLYFKVKIQRRSGASQCFNCNLHHHTAAACHLTPRCLTCREAHLICNVIKLSH
ncbi:hypothetical protein AVEN_18655-1 [Araneus ventricosus]|uniref:Pre-C2HC domain-containing protein n=1 Tax=Araneus ventricosus TaxID=182803 RepID=A0A4Y2RRE3_ARAVE|nr:hypothetical protein AVEN_18655-1 [Araneus ventricosus]